MMIMFFELLGTLLLTTLYMMNKGNALSMFIGYFILLILSARISGSHYNPIVTLAFMLRKDAGQFNRWLGILYMMFQLVGALAGAFIAYYVFRAVPGADQVLAVYENPKGVQLVS
jgi:glycerol uptake facilitator-like aquaporin